LPGDVSIAREKATHYLLIGRHEDDKSAFLARGGYLPFNPDALLLALTRLGKRNDARPLRWNEFGSYYELRGILPGIADGRRLQVRTIWMTDHLSGNTKFLTLIPEKVLS
jgi:hypothetical protein